MDIIVIISALLFSAFFSGMEIAYISANRLRIEIERKQSRMYSSIFGLFLRHPGQYISTMLVGNNIALVVYSLFMSGVIGRYLTGNIVVETLISTLLIIVFAEFLPKGVVKKSPNRYLRIFALPACLFYGLFYPLTRFTGWLSVGILRLLGVIANDDSRMSVFGKVDLQTLVEQTSDSDQAAAVDNEKELQILQNALDFSELKVRECMVPRVEIEAADIDSTPEELLEIFTRTHYSRIPLYEGSIDNIVGYASQRSMFDAPSSVSQIKREILYVPESGSVQKLLNEFIRKRKSMSVVIDEFGSTAGIITIEDILEQIVGEIEDEHDKEYMVERELSDGRWLFSGRQEIDHLNETYDLQIPESEEYETLAGYILYNSEDFPNVGETMIIGNWEFKIVRASSNKISLVETSKPHSESTNNKK